MSLEMIYYLVVFFIFGISFGSFYNVVGYRLSKGMSLISPGSNCPNCAHMLSPLELIPVISYIFLKGRCKKCHKKISLFYPIAEILTGLLFSLSFLVFGLTFKLIIALILVSIFVIIIVSDMRFFIIPDEILVFSIIVITIAYFINYGYDQTMIYLGSGTLAFMAMYLVMVLGNVAFKKESMGGGDIKLMFLAGLALGFFEAIVVFFVSAIIAFPIALYAVFRNKEHIIAYGPFIAFSIVLLYFSQININQILDFFLKLY